MEDCRHLSRRLEAGLLAAGERIVQVPPTLMAHARDAARSYGTSDPIDALAIARAAAREPDLPVAHLDEVARALRLLVDHREDLLAARTRHLNRLRWHLHEIDPAWDPKPQALITYKHLALCSARLGDVESVVGAVALDLVARVRALTFDIRRLEAEIAERTTKVAPVLLQVHGVAALSAAKIIGEVAGVMRFRSATTIGSHEAATVR